MMLISLNRTSIKGSIFAKKFFAALRAAMLPPFGRSAGSLRSLNASASRLYSLGLAPRLDLFIRDATPP